MTGPPRPNRHQWAEARRWLMRADEDWRAAEALIALTPPAIDPAAFHCQQAAEKIAKAVLIALGLAAPRLHDIEALGRLLAPYHSAIGEVLIDLGGLGLWYMATRYPDAGLPVGPSFEDAREVLSRLRALRRSVETLDPDRGGAAESE